MKILLVGASGFIGRHIHSALQSGEHQLFCASRRSGVDLNRMLQVDDWLPLLDGVDLVINGAGIIAESRKQRFINVHGYAPVALFKACVRAGVKRVIQLSALGVGRRVTTDFLLSKQIADDFLQTLPLDWFILRPSLVCGEGGRSTELLHRVAQLPCLPLIDRGEQWLQPVYIDDLVATVERCMASEKSHQVIDVVGAKRIRLGDWLQDMHNNSLGIPLRIVNVPISIAMTMARFGSRFSPLVSRDNLRMLLQGSTSDVRPFAEFIGRMPLGAGEFRCHIQ